MYSSIFKGRILVIFLLMILVYICVLLTLFDKVYKERQKFPERKNYENGLRMRKVHNISKTESVKDHQPKQAKPVSKQQPEILPFHGIFHKYPLEVDMEKLVKEYKNKGKTNVSQINPYNYEFLHLPKKSCNKSSVDLIFLIKSSPGNFERRKAIRETWGNETMWTAITINRVFLVGYSANKTLASEIILENKVHEDILHISFTDNYYNNTLKTIGGLKWTYEYCKKASFVVVGDDDYYFGVILIWNHVSQLHPLEAKTFIYGKKGQQFKVQRWKGGKWSVNADVWPYDKYPPFLLAGALIMSSEVAWDLYIASLYTKMFIFDDVYIGILCYKLRITLNNSKFMFEDKEGFLLRKPRYIKYKMAVHGYKKYKDMVELWKKYLNSSQQQDT